MGNDACFEALDLPTNATQTAKVNCEGYPTADKLASFAPTVTMCKYAAGDEERGWEHDCYTNPDFITNATSLFPTQCAVQEDLQTIADSCERASESVYNDTTRKNLTDLVKQWGCNSSKPSPAKCPENCQDEIKHYLDLCSTNYVKWDDMVSENKRLIEALGCSGATGSQAPMVALVFAILLSIGRPDL